MRWNAAVARASAASVRSRALRLRPSVFLCMCSLQRRNDVHKIVSLLFIHFDLPSPPVRIRFANHALRLAQFRLVDIEEAGIGTEMGAVQAGIRVRARPGNNGYRAVTVG